MSETLPPELAGSAELLQELIEGADSSEVLQNEDGEEQESGRVTLREALANPEQSKDALRNERAGDLPDLTSVIDEGTEALAEVIREVVEQAEGPLEQRWPDDPPDDKSVETKRLGVDIDGILAGVSIRDGLVAAITGVVRDAMQEGADTEAEQVAGEIAERVDDADAEIVASVEPLP